MSWRSPEQGRRWREVMPDDAGTGADPPDMADAPSDLHLPAWDQAQSKTAATIGPASFVEQVGPPVRAITDNCCSCAFASAPSSRARRADALSLVPSPPFRGPTLVNP